MKNGSFRIAALFTAFAFLSGCSTSTVITYGDNGQESLISAAEFDAMIQIEIRELEPLPVDQAVASID